MVRPRAECSGRREKRPRAPPPPHTMGYEETDASRTRPRPFLPPVDGGCGGTLKPQTRGTGTFIPHVRVPGKKAVVYAADPLPGREKVAVATACLHLFQPHSHLNPTQDLISARVG
eukprot:gene23243-biopygen4303